MRRLFLLMLLLGISTSIVHAQLPYFRQYLFLKKNEPVQVNTMLQDKTGYLWFGTNKGLFRFDGLNKTRFTKANGLPEEDVTALAQDSAGTIWIGHKGGAVASFSAGKIAAFNPPEGTPVAPISDILIDRTGVMWLATQNDGLYYYLNNRLYRLDEQEGMPDTFVYDLLEDKKGNIWAGTDRGVAVCTRTDAQVSIKVINYKNGLPDNIIKKLNLGTEDFIWMATEDAGIFKYDPVAGKEELLMPGGWDYGTVLDFKIIGDNIWISSQETGLIVHDLAHNKTKVYNAKAAGGFSAVLTMLEDHEGNIWAGTRTGVMRTHGDDLEFIEKLDPAMDVNVVAVTTDHCGNIWFATSEGLFMRRVDRAGMPVTEKKLAGTVFENYSVISLYTDASGYVWAGFFGEGVVRIHPLSGQTRHFSKELKNGNVLNITGRGNVVWLATLGGGTSITTSDHEQPVVTNYGTAEGLISDYIYQVFVDSQDRVWFATDGKGVDVLDKNGFNHYQEGLGNKVIYGFAEDSNQTLWVNVQGEGLYKLEGEKFTPLAASVKLSDTNISALATNKTGNLVVMHDLGIDIVDTKQMAVFHWGEETGIRDKKATLNAVAKDDEGNILIGTDGGIIRFSAFANVPVFPVPHIRNLRVLNEDKDMAGDLSFPHDENSITVQYLGFWYQNPEHVFYRYRLDHYDQDWIQSQDESATYSSLPPGDYTFRVQASSTEDFTRVSETNLHFEVRAPFWKTTTFYVVCVLALLFTGYFVIQYRERKLIQDKRILEERVEERTLEIQRKTEEIQAQNEEIQAQAEEIQGINENLEGLVKQRTIELERKNQALEEYAFINAHELRAPVASILGLINLISKTNVDKESKEILNHLEESAEKLNTVVRSITKAIERGD